MGFFLTEKNIYLINSLGINKQKNAHGIWSKRLFLNK